ncbi:MAG TPA: outer membrane protein assembly factor BamA [Candidatus Binatia bacterium]|nr:outer membrane protein assembly factor BamA [Candidatus Binatia bacterium]
MRLVRGVRGCATAISCFLALLFFAASCLAQQEVIQNIVIHGNRRIPAETIRARMFTKAGDVYDQAALERDFNSLWNTGYFDDLRIEREQSSQGWIIHVYVKEKPTIREIKYVGLSSVSQSDVLDKFKEQKVGLTQESQYDPTKVKHAEVVIKQLLAAHGRQFATVQSEVRPIPPAAVSLTFVVKEGPKVKVGKIRFEGNKALKSRDLQRAMKNLKPIGIPHSIILENLFARTYDSTKLTEDAERVRYFYQTKGYFKALVGDPRTQIHDTSGVRWYFPFKSSPGKAVDITMPVEEGQRYRLKEITFSGNKAVKNTQGLRALFKIKNGEIFDTEAIRKGLEALRKAYAALGYINFTPVPNTEADDEKRLISLRIDLDEGKQFYVRRIEFQGNTTTRDKVIRRELALEEGQVYNGNLWELSLLRLNQLQYFDQLKPEQDSEIKQNVQDGTVDITLKVKEKGKNSIGLTGGVSGLAGAFVGLNYTTNNLFGKGESLTLQFEIGQYERNETLSFTQPYLFDRPLQFGWSVYHNSYNYNQAALTQIQLNQTLNLPASYQALLQNFTQTSTGFTTSLSYPIKRTFKRVGITYAFDNSSVQTFSAASTAYFEALAFRGISGPNALNGIITSKVVPNFSFTRIDNPQRPHTGQSLYLATEFAGLGGNVKYLKPIAEYKKFHPVNKGRNTLGFRMLGSWITGYGGQVAPPFDRFYMGGDTDIRGFDIRAISPVSFFPTVVVVPLQNPDGSIVPLNPANPRQGNYNITIPVEQIIFPGGDTNLVTNLEYRVPIIGPVTIAPFVDTGWDFISRSSQLQIAETQVTTLQTTVFGCPGVNSSFQCVGGTTLPISPVLRPVSGTNYQTRMSTGLELQVILPVVNAPFRVYWAYNPLRINEVVNSPNPITRSMFPPGAAGDYTYAQTISIYQPKYYLAEPLRTFRFTVATTF